jgi:putative hydrolase
VVELHTHTVLSDGILIPAELARRAEVRGLEAVAFTDHVDGSLIDHVVPRLVSFCAEYNKTEGIRVLPGVEITHVRPSLIAALVERARGLGAAVVIVHGETPVEPVVTGTNRAGIEAKPDILAHPGRITRSDAELAATNGVLLEISGRQGHCLCNGHVVRAAAEVGACIVFGSDAHAPDDLCTWEEALRVLRGAGLSEEEALAARDRARALVAEALARMNPGQGPGGHGRNLTKKHCH